MDLSWAFAMGLPELNGEDMAARAVALGNRLLEVESSTLLLRGEAERLRRELNVALDAGGGATGGWFEVPRTQHGWPLADDMDASEASLQKYDRRVDDAVLLQGRLGQAFLTRFDLESATPDFATAVEALNAAPRGLQVIGAESGERPDVSIIIPVYGQLGYTLNCIDSLLSHTSVHSAEIIIIDDRSPDQTGAFLPAMRDIRYHLQPVNGGFIRSCNTGGAMARGRYVIMLNNDTRVVDGWLDNLIGSFKLFPKAGLVGSKLLYSDGTLQEAGGIIWRSGVCWNYGRNDDPSRPQYSHARQVDYISGCSIALPIELWTRLEGFDPLFTPAYCEDADLGLRVAAAGYEVWYQPQSRIVHYEGKTSGVDTGKGVKAYQVVNTRKLYLRWREKLESHRRDPEAPYFERERTVRRRILVIDTSAPTPNQDAGSLQTVLGLKVCRDLGYKPHFVPEDNWLFQAQYTTDLQAMGVECAYAPYDLGFQSYIRRYGDLFDVVLVYRMSVLERTLADIRAYARNACLLFHIADLHYLRKQREAELEGSEEGLAEALSIKRRELALVTAADCTITHSTVEATVLGEETPGAPVVVWPLMYEVFGTSVPFAERRDICFLGGYRHTPNIDAVKYFVSEIYSLVRAADPSIRFIIAGSNTTAEVLELAGNGVEVIGLVDDLRDLFDRTRVFVCPLRIGAGAKGKVMSALAYGIPIVSTSVGIEGAGLEPEEHVLLADRPADFADKILQLYNDEALWQSLSIAGQEVLHKKFSAEMGRTALESAVAIGHRHRLGLDYTS
jgi:O-antigen biosynthesis protein